MGEKKNVQEKQINLSAILGIFRRNIIPLILVTAVFAAGFFVYSRYFITKKYEASAMIIVNNASEKNVVNANDLHAAQSLADVYSIIIKSDPVLQPAIKKAGISATPDSLKKFITVTTVNDTQIIKISMTHSDANYAKKVIAAIVEVAPAIIKDKVEAGSVNKVSDARITNNGAPVSPNNVKNAMVGAIIGFLLTLAIVLIKEFSNNTFKTEDDVSKILGIPLLGAIPLVDTKEFNKNV